MRRPFRHGAVSNSRSTDHTGAACAGQEARCAKAVAGLVPPRRTGENAGSTIARPGTSTGAVEEFPMTAARTTPPGKHVVLYDGHCKFCTAGAQKLRALARPGAIE